jgi:hypothetical protein
VSQVESGGIVGQTFGYLKAERPTDRVSASSGTRVWVFTCLICGKACERAIGSVRYSVKQGCWPSCDGCQGAARMVLKHCPAEFPSLRHRALAAAVYLEDFGPRLKPICPTERVCGRNRVWRFSCSCGATVERSVQDVRNAVRSGAIPSCSACQTRRCLRQRKPAPEKPPRISKVVRVGKDCVGCAGLPHRRPEDGTPCQCGGVYQAEAKVEPVLRRAV